MAPAKSKVLSSGYGKENIVPVPTKKKIDGAPKLPLVSSGKLSQNSSRTSLVSETVKSKRFDNTVSAIVPAVRKKNISSPFKSFSSVKPTAESTPVLLKALNKPQEKVKLSLKVHITSPPAVRKNVPFRGQKPVKSLDKTKSSSSVPKTTNQSHRKVDISSEKKVEDPIPSIPPKIRGRGCKENKEMCIETPLQTSENEKHPVGPSQLSNVSTSEGVNSNSDSGFVSRDASGLETPISSILSNISSENPLQTSENEKHPASPSQTSNVSTSEGVNSHSDSGFSSRNASGIKTPMSSILSNISSENTENSFGNALENKTAPDTSDILHSISNPVSYIFSKNHASLESVEGTGKTVYVEFQILFLLLLSFYAPVLAVTLFLALILTMIRKALRGCPRSQKTEDQDGVPLCLRVCCELPTEKTSIGPKPDLSQTTALDGAKKPSKPVIREINSLKESTLYRRIFYWIDGWKFQRQNRWRK